MRLAPEGAPQMIVGTVVLGAGAVAAAVWFWPAMIPLLLVWGWGIAFFRDPKREGTFAAGEMCSPADGRVVDITGLENCAEIGRPAVRVGIFLSLFNVHINRSPCHGNVQSITYQRGKFVAAMKPAAGDCNESNTLVLAPASPLPGPVAVRQVAGLAARRIICHARAGSELSIGERFGLIKFGSRTELIVPALPGTEVLVRVGDQVRAGLTPLIRQPLTAVAGGDDDRDTEDAGRVASASTSATA